MIEVRKDWLLLVEATESTRRYNSEEMLATWFMNPNNIMLVKDNNVGVVTYQKPGIYNVHWYYQVRGREAINLGKEMVRFLFDNYDIKVACGIIKKHLKASRWACRQLGFKSQGFITYEDGDVNELLFMTKEQMNDECR